MGRTDRKVNRHRYRAHPLTSGCNKNIMATSGRDQIPCFPRGRSACAAANPQTVSGSAMVTPKTGQRPGNAIANASNGRFTRT